MKNYSKPGILPAFSSLGYSKQHICECLKENGALSDSEMITKLGAQRKMNPKTIRVNRRELVDKEIVLHDEINGKFKYRLRKDNEILIERSGYENTTIINNGKIENTFKKWVDINDIKEVPLEIRKALLKKPFSKD